MAITRERLAASRRAETFRLDALDDEVRLRQFSAAERVALMGLFHAAGATEDPAEQHAKHQDITAKLVQLTLVDEDDQRLYGDDELDALQDDLSSDALDQLGDRAMVFCGLAEQDDAAKKSRGSRSDAGSTGSA